MGILKLHEQGNLSEWLRRKIRNLLGFARAGSSPAVVVIFFTYDLAYFVNVFFFLSLVHKYHFTFTELCTLHSSVRSLIFVLLFSLTYQPTNCQCFNTHTTDNHNLQTSVLNKSNIYFCFILLYKVPLLLFFRLVYSKL